MTPREMIFNGVLLAGLILLAAGSFGIGWRPGCVALGVAIIGTCWRMLRP